MAFVCQPCADDQQEHQQQKSPLRKTSNDGELSRLMLEAAVVVVSGQRILIKSSPLLFSGLE